MFSSSVYLSSGYHSSYIIDLLQLDIAFLAWLGFSWNVDQVRVTVDSRNNGEDVVVACLSVCSR